MAKYVCKDCGQEFDNPRVLLSGLCAKSRTGRHELYEGGYKRIYTCKYCGQRFPSIKIMVGLPCSMNRGGNHSPSL